MPTSSQAKRIKAGEDFFVFSGMVRAPSIPMTRIWSVLFFGYPIFLVNGPHQQVGYESDDQQSGHDVKHGLIGAGFFDAVGQLIFAEVVDERRTEHACRRPCGEDSAVNGADVMSAEEIADVSGNGGEAAAVHAEEDDGDGDEELYVINVGCAGEWQQVVEDSAEAEENKISGFAADEVGGGGPEKAACHIEEAEQADEASGSDGAYGAFEELLN